MSMGTKEVDFEETWGRISDTIEKVIELEPVSKKEWNDRFPDIYNLCVARPLPFEEQLYHATKQFFEKHVSELRKKVSQADSLLSEYRDHWEKYNKGSNFINNLYRYLNSTFTQKKKQEFGDHSTHFPVCPSSFEKDMVEVGQMALEIWKSKMMDITLFNDIKKALIDEITRDRNGECPSESCTHDVIMSLIEVEQYESKTPLKLYQDLFETPFFKETSDYYKNEASKFRSDFSDDCSAYMQKVASRLDEERLRGHRYLHPSSYDRLMSVCQGRLVEDHLQMLQNEFRPMIQGEKFEDLGRMYKLLKSLSCGKNAMLEEFERHIVETGLSNVKALYTENGTGQFVDALLAMHKKYSEMIQSTFCSDQAFFGARDKACTKIVNYKMDPKKPCRSPELLAKYCDSLLRKSTKNVTEQEIDDKLNNAIVIFKYLDDKDVFQKFYARLLAKRLIHNLSVSIDFEEGMINRLKLACGYEYTNKLHRMFTDMKISEDINNKFSSYVERKSIDLGINFSLLVLQCGAWPLGQAVSSALALPGELVKSVQVFESFYNELYNGRKLTWMQHLSNGELKMTYLKKPYIVTVATYQMAILLLFNDSESLSYSEMELQSQIGDKELPRVIQSLIDAKLLYKTSHKDTELEASTFTLNWNFSNKRTKFKITISVQKESQQDVEQTITAVDDDRKMYIQAAIVRILKSRKVLKHNVLIEEIIEQAKSRFSPSISLIKKCIEALIDKQYIERVPNTKDQYTYVA